MPVSGAAGKESQRRTDILKYYYVVVMMAGEEFPAHTTIKTHSCILHMKSKAKKLASQIELSEKKIVAIVMSDNDTPCNIARAHTHIRTYTQTSASILFEF